MVTFALSILIGAFIYLIFFLRYAVKANRMVSIVAAIIGIIVTAVLLILLSILYRYLGG